MRDDSVMPLGEFLAQIKAYNPKANLELIEKAYKYSKEKHKNQKRASGEEYFIHPLGVVKILIEMKADSATICSGLLHDVVEDTGVSLATIREEFGDVIASIVEGLTKMDKVHFESAEDYTAENLRKVLLASTKDIRVMLIKLADRLHNMWTLKYLSEEKQKRIAEETMNIYAPIANKLGIRAIKGELEDACLKVLQPEVYNSLKKKIVAKRDEREKRTEHLIGFIKDGLESKNVKATVLGRAKYFYSIYKKMLREDKDFNEIYDLIAIRIIVKQIPDCYSALGLVHELWKPMPGRFKDYISVPKANGYQSLHTSVFADGKILEIQIRTPEMDSLSEDGIAAHWRYKGTERDKKFERKIAWLKQVLQWKAGAKNAQEFIETFFVKIAVLGHSFLCTVILPSLV